MFLLISRGLHVIMIVDSPVMSFCCIFVQASICFVNYSRLVDTESIIKRQVKARYIVIKINPFTAKAIVSILVPKLHPPSSSPKHDQVHNYSQT